MRAVRLLAAFLLVSASVPADAAAQVRSVAAANSRAVPSVAGAGLSSSFSTPLSLMPLMSLTPLSSPLSALTPAAAAAPALQAAVSPASIKSVAVPRIEAVKPSPLSVRVEAASALTKALPDIPLAAAPAAAAQSFSLLTGEALTRRADSPAVLAAPAHFDSPFLSAATPAPRSPAPSPETSKNVRRMMVGTAVMKSGMETITLSVPMLALTAFGGISAVAGLVVVYGLSQAVFAAMAGGLADRFSARKVLAGAVLAQAALVGTLIAVGALGALSMPTLIPLYLLIGGVTGVIETTRHSIPTLLLGQDEAALKKYNAKLHISYEVAGVIGALTAGALIAFVGPLWSLAIQPPAFALAAWYFWRVRHPLPAGGPPAKSGALAKVKDYFRDIKAGAKLVMGDGRMRWLALAFVLPQIVHRVFENLLIPVFAKTVLENPSASAWLLTASNAGELAGAAVLLRLAARFPGSHGWVKWGALGLLLTWALAFSTSLPLLLPLILFSSLTWAASDLSLRSEVQRSVSEKEQPRAISFLYGAFVIGSSLLSLALGGLLGAMPAAVALYWICGGFSAIALAVFLASRRLKP
ncbi:MAG: MFS transporter [Elusimicrobia bacterium]|nr:MFS transporter [Elusimicrobiota bacterium]